jgi:tetratricopeptide (TPR) repeat protein
VKAARRLTIFLFFFVLIPHRIAVAADQPPTTIAEARTLYEHGNFDAAVDMYRGLLKIDSKNADAYAGLTRTLLKQKKVEEARLTVDEALKTVDSPTLRTAAAEVQFREGSISEAERKWVDVINSGHPEGRAFLGLARVSDAFSLYKRAQTMIEKAHAADPNDADIRKAWLGTLRRSERIKYLEEYLSQGNPDDAEVHLHMQQYLEYLKARALGPASACRLVSNVTSTDAPLVNLLRDPSHLRGYGYKSPLVIRNPSCCWIPVPGEF